MFRSATVFFLVCFLPTSCTSPGDDDDATVLVRDSVGITVLEHSSSSSSDTVSAAAALRIGKEGDAAYEFHRITGIQVLSSGNIVVADGGASNIRFYQPDGTHIRTIGRRGEGPSEFGGLAELWLARDDTLVAHDRGRRRLVHFDSSGAFSHAEEFSEAFPETPVGAPAFCAPPRVGGRLLDGSVLINGWECPQFEGADGIRAIETTLLLTGGDQEEPIGRFRAGHLFERASAAHPRESYVLLPIGASLDVATAHRLYVSEGVDYEILVHDGQGALVEIWRERVRPPLVQAEHRESLEDHQWGSARGVSPVRPLPERFGGYSRIIRAEDGSLWGKREGPPGADFGEWVIYSPDGRSMRTLVLPEIEAFAVGSDHIWGYQVSEIGIQTLVALRIPPSRGP